MTETFNNFNDIQHLPLRVFNRTILFNNIFTDFGKESASEYIEQFSQGERKQMFVMQAYIKKFGYKFAKEKVTEGLEFDSVEEGPTVVH